MIEKVSFQII